jgi:peptidoglycan/LPS O-acetylase OafA/YrhL
LFIFSTPAGVWGNYPLIWAGTLWLVSTVLAAGVAWLSFRGIEKPFMELAKRICLRLVPLRAAFPICAQAGAKQPVVI